ncbi:type I 3-dehydroquinate dehydratase [Paenibacillus sp. sgz500958]|uniref:type I 3-dehydroquinate dehydratase n=1 Tax=Paenibacillus sp. sgz500958 TaxID=3242475 RepID=UPI0036D25BEF
MSATVTVRNVVIGEGMPKICVPLTGVTLSELKQEAEAIKDILPDLVEWRVDFYEQVEDMDAVVEALGAIRSILPELPLLFTFRSAKEGGQKQVSEAYYTALNKAAAESGLADLVDVELFSGDEVISEIVATAHACMVPVVISNHDFNGTPPKEELVARLRRARELGADLPKIAVMPKHASDVLTLLDATLTMKEQYADCPLITMSMSGEGAISRLAGEVFGSAVTFGSAGKPSAPGQIDAGELRKVLNLLHYGL